MLWRDTSPSIGEGVVVSDVPETEVFWRAFDRIAAKRDRATAIEQDAVRRCSYAELQIMSCEVARMIRDAGLQRRSVIAIRAAKSIEYVASLIGVWRAGCVALPLPDAIPTAVRGANGRRAGVVATLLADSSLQPGVRIELSKSVEGSRSNGVDQGCPDGNSELDEPAYIFFTSGSTGEPKGVMVTHRGLVPVLESQIKAFGLNQQTRSLFYLSICFDASLSDIGTALLCGGTLVIESDATSLPPELLIRRMDELSITYADLPPAIVSRIGRLRLKLPRSLSTVVIGGDVCGQDGIDWFSSQLDLFNVYGPTEATICTSIKKCTVGQTPTIGNPIAAMRYQLVSRDVHPADGFGSELDRIGVCDDEGELWISGPGLATGYIDDEVLTHQKFVFQTIDGEDETAVRWYRTGDRVRKSDSGEFDFAGRLDRQFKLLGQLVEPEQIHRRVLEHDSIEDASIVPLRDERGSVRAIGVLVKPTDETDMDVADLREHLRSTLPTWMVPSNLKVVDAIPKTPQGKTDLVAATTLLTQSRRSELPEPESANAQMLHSLWAKVLGHTDFGWDDTLDSVGGSSLSAMEILAAAQAHGIRIAPADLLRSSLRDCLQRADAATVMTTDALSVIVADMVKSTPKLPKCDVINRGQRNILLTGATGFLGTWVVEQWMRQPGDTELCCLVRAADTAQAMDRIDSARMQYLDTPMGLPDSTRIRLVCGDITAPRFGLSQGDWDRLATEVTDVVHLAARVHLIDGFESLRAANLDSISTIATFMNSGIAKTLHYASTLSVFVATDREATCYHEADRLAEPARVYGGYGQTKWAAEKLLWEIAGNQIPAVYRLGLLTGDTERGIGPAQDQLASFTRGIVRLGCYPAGLDELRFDVTPVDEAARGIVRLVRGNHAGAFHLCAPEPVSFSRWMGAIARTGIELKPVSDKHFADAVEQFRCDGKSDTAEVQEVVAAGLALNYRVGRLRGPFPTFPTGGEDSSSRSLDLFLATDTRFDAARADGVLREFGESIGPISDGRLDQLVNTIMDPTRGVNR